MLLWHLKAYEEQLICFDWVLSETKLIRGLVPKRDNTILLTWMSTAFGSQKTTKYNTLQETMQRRIPNRNFNRHQVNTSIK